MNPSTQPRISDVPDHTRDPRFNSRSKARCAVIKAILNVPDGTGLLARGKTTVRTRSSRLGSDGWCGPADEDTENGDDQDRGAQDQTDHPALVLPVAYRGFLIAPLRVFAKAGHVRSKPFQGRGKIGFHDLHILLYERQLLLQRAGVGCVGYCLNLRTSA